MYSLQNHNTKSIDITLDINNPITADNKLESNIKPIAGNRTTRVLEIVLKILSFKNSSLPSNKEHQI